MTPADLNFLLSNEGEKWLGQVDFDEHDHLWWATFLRDHLFPAQVHAVLETVLLRERARAKFSKAEALFFTRPALEQASGEIVAAYRARRMRALTDGVIADLGCSIGGDAISLAAGGAVIGVERDYLRLRMAKINVERSGNGPRFWPVQADLRALPPIPVDALFFDPARRDAGGRRIFSPSGYLPPPSILNPWRSVTPHHAVKVSPGIDYADLPSEAEAEAEFVSVEGELKECIWWFGGFQSDAARRATILPGGNTLFQKRGEEGVEPAVVEPGRYLLEPDPAVIRAHLVGELGELIGGRLISPDIAYLTLEDPVETPFGALFRIETWFPFQLKTLKRYVRDQKIGLVEVKKRGSPIDPNELARALRGPGENQATIFLTRVLGNPAIIVGQRL